MKLLKAIRYIFSKRRKKKNTEEEVFDVKEFMWCGTNFDKRKPDNIINKVHTNFDNDKDIN